MSLSTTPAPATATAGGDDVPKPDGRVTKLVRYLPCGDTIIHTGRTTVKVLDARIPHIRGRPALSELLANLKPGLTVALVSLPLSISLAIAADATPVQGVITAVWAGLTSALVGGSHYNIVGPTGALSGILSQFSVRYGPGVQPLLAILAGAISLVVWLLRLERFFVFIPSAVMHGFTLGVAFIISFNQLNFALGLPKLPRHERFLDNVWENVRNAHQLNWFAFLFFLASFAGLTMMQRRMGKVPWSIVLAALGIVIGLVQEAMGWTIRLDTIQSRYGDLQMQLVQVSEVFTTGLNVGFDGVVHLLTGSVSIAVVAVLETLISAHIADRMTKTLFNPRREVLSVGLSNLLSGFTGGIPATAALARTALNIKSGATSRAAGIINGICIMLLSTVLFGLFKYLPLPVVAAILVNVAARMVEWPEVRLLYKMDKPMFLVAIISALVCIVEDPTAGIIVGAFLGMVRLLMQMRNAHALLRVYRGSRCTLHFLFEGVDVAKPVAACRSKYTNEKGVVNEAAKAVSPVAVMTRVEAGLDGAPDAHTTLRAGVDASGIRGMTPAAEVEAARARKAARRERKAAKRAAAGGHGMTDSDAMHMGPDPRDAALPTVALYMLPGYFSFVSAQAHRDRVRALFMAGDASLPGINIVAFSLSESYFADPDALETIGSLQEELRRHGYEVYLLGFHARVLRSIHKAHWFHEIRNFPEYPALLHFLRDQVNETGEYVQPQPPTGHHHHHHHGRAEGDGDTNHGHDHAPTASDGTVAAPSAATVPASSEWGNADDFAAPTTTTPAGDEGWGAAGTAIATGRLGGGSSRLAP